MLNPKRKSYIVHFVVVWIILLFVALVFQPTWNPTIETPPTETPSIPRLSDFQFSRFCAQTPMFLTEGASKIGSTKLTMVENTPGNFVGKLEVVGKTTAIIKVNWTDKEGFADDNLVVQIIEPSGYVRDARESANFDHGGITLMLGLNNSNEVLVFRVPFELDKLMFVIANRSDLVEYHKTCP